MDKIYVGQTWGTIERIMDQDITGATVTKIKYIKPSGATGEWTAVVTNAALGYITYSLSNEIATPTITESRVWKTWGYIGFADGRHADGDLVNMKIYQPGE